MGLMVIDKAKNARIQKTEKLNIQRHTQAVDFDDVKKQLLIFMDPHLRIDFDVFACALIEIRTQLQSHYKETKRRENLHVKPMHEQKALHITYSSLYEMIEPASKVDNSKKRFERILASLVKANFLEVESGVVLSIGPRLFVMKPGVRRSFCEEIGFGKKNWSHRVIEAVLAPLWVHMGSGGRFELSQNMMARAFMALDGLKKDDALNKARSVQGYLERNEIIEILSIGRPGIATTFLLGENARPAIQRLSETYKVKMRAAREVELPANF
ncbi:MAG: hypothetical protein H7318_14210 [Oligoflexus sp.]|nr:hypothetical protein [Oligoflexus sp.]